MAARIDVREVATWEEFECFRVGKRASELNRSDEEASWSLGVSDGFKKEDEIRVLGRSEVAIVVEIESERKSLN